MLLKRGGIYSKGTHMNLIYTNSAYLRCRKCWVRIIIFILSGSCVCGLNCCNVWQIMKELWYSYQMDMGRGKHMFREYVLM